VDSSKRDTDSISTDCIATNFDCVEGQVTCAFGENEKVCQDGQWVDTNTDNCRTSLCNRDNVCDATESFELCGGKQASDNDCATCNLNGICEATESSYSCSADCGEIQPPIASWVYWVAGMALAIIVYVSAGMIKPKKGKGRRVKRRRKR
jgi:hypothetical protein